MVLASCLSEAADEGIPKRDGMWAPIDSFLNLHHEQAPASFNNFFEPMACPVIWWQTPLFYAIGNTPPACLTRDIGPEEKAQVLLLGCGDPRSILYTIHHDLDANRYLDVTCCDMETAVLARNILLLSMLGDGIPWHDSWRIFYHFFLDDDALNILFTQTATLIDSAVTFSAWNSSKYGKYLRFCTEHSMTEIRRQWELYLAIKDLPNTKKEALKKSFFLQMKQSLKIPNVDVSIIRSATPLFGDGVLQLGQSIFETYWKTGVLNGRSSRTPSAPNANPIFAYSLAGHKFNAYYGINPITAFHVTPTLAQFNGFPFPTSKIAVEDFVETAMHQFSNWCTSFHARVNREPSSVAIRFFAGDCIPFGKALRKCYEDKKTTTGIHTRPWGVSQIIFSSDYDETSSPPAPLLFNVIDTSNLADSLGLLNVLLVTVPLLQRKPWSVLHTNTLVRSTPGKIVISALRDRLFADIATLSLFLGVTPSSELSPFTTHSSREEEVSAGAAHQYANQFHQLISWRYPASIAPLNSILPCPELGDEPELLGCDETQLAAFLYSVYTKMFLDERIDDSPASMLRRINIQYVRTSFVELLSFVRRRGILVNWGKTMDHLIGLVGSDRTLLLGSNSYQDLICQLYLGDVYTIDSLRWGFVKQNRTRGDLFEGWDEVPPVVSVVLKVPRSRLRVLQDTINMETGNPVLICDTMGLRGENLHSSIRPTFGELRISGRRGDAQATIDEDPAGWEGNSPLLISFDVPSWLFTEPAKITSVGARIRPSPQSSRLFMSKIGDIRMRFFEAAPTDGAHVYVTRRRPNNACQEICRPKGDDVMSKSTRTFGDHRDGTITMGFEKSGPSPKVTSLTLRHAVVDPDAAKSLAGGANVSARAISDTAMLATFEGYEQVFRFPFPIHGDKTKTRIARKSSYIEIVGSMRTGGDISAVNCNPFPISRAGASLNLLNVPYVNLATMPAFSLPIPPARRTWLTPFLAWVYPDNRLKVRSEAFEIAVGIKRSVSAMVIHASAAAESVNVFAIANPDPKRGTYVFIFVNELRFDLSSRSVVIDACAVPLTRLNASKVLAAIHVPTTTVTIKDDDDGRAWKAALPVFAERCRTWKHTDQCEYKEKPGYIIPACHEKGGAWTFDASPLCSCGLGKDLGGFADRPEWRSIRSEATRVAIAPFFPSCLLEYAIALQEAADAGSTTATTSSGLLDDEEEVCWRCGGPGLPKLLVCGQCRRVKYCSQTCQRAHWKMHKPNCCAKT